MLEAQQLVKQYGERRAVDDLSFRVYEGETLGFLGPNGAGKSTTIRMLVGALRPDSGQITLAGMSDPTRREVKRILGYVPQELAVYEDLTGRENLDFFGRLQGLAGQRLRSRVDFALDFSGLNARAKDRVGSYSGGMKRRLNLVIALLHEPELLFLDEATVGVDPQSRAHIFANIEELQERGTTILFTTHSMDAAQQLCDRVAIIDHGRMLAIDQVDVMLREHGGCAELHVELHEVPAQPERLPGQLEGKTLRLATENPFKTLAELEPYGLAVKQIEIVRADLERVFLELTGRSLRDS